ncbi:MAG: EboA domain-containing protein [Planctomycetota bacterium]
MRTILETALTSRSDGGPLDWWHSAVSRVETEGPEAIPVLLPALTRRLGSSFLCGGLRTEPLGGPRPARVDLDAWRLADAAGLVLLRIGKPDDRQLTDLYHHGDLEERTILLRAIGLLPVTDGSIELLSQALRSNVETHFSAAVCDSNLPVRAAAHPGFGVEGFNRLVLKAAFLAKPLSALLDVECGANVELSRMLQDLASEREIAGRMVWPGTNLLIAYAPTDGTFARIVGGLEHGDDQQRRAAAEGLEKLARDDLVPFARERLPREPRPVIRAILRRIVGE